MGHEIERKFLVGGAGWRTPDPKRYRQGYLSTAPERTVRVRVGDGGAWLTIKGATSGATRSEFEYAIPRPDAEALLELCEEPVIEKRRHVVEHAGHTWEVDEFEGANAGLVVAEIELAHEHEPFERPAWLGPEVTADARYTNAALVRRPYRTWST